MNTTYILELARENSVNGIMGTDTFERLFGFVDESIRCIISQMIAEDGIELVDETMLSELVSTGDMAEEADSLSYCVEFVAHDAARRVDKSMTNEQLVLLAQHGNEDAASLLCSRNEGLIRKAARAYMGYCGNDLEMDDLMQEGSIGLLRAIGMYRFTIGTKFTTYATIWIRQKIRRAIVETGFTIQLPVHMMDRITKAVRLDNQFANEGVTDLGERIDRIAAEMGLKVEDVEFAMDKARQLLKPTSLDLPVGEDCDTSLGDLVAVSTEDTPEELMLKADLHETLENIIDSLTLREQQVIRSRYGLENGIRCTLEQLGAQMGVTRERVRQIETKALGKLSRRSVLRELAA